MIFYGNFTKILKRVISEFHFKAGKIYKCISYNFLFALKDRTLKLQADPSQKVVTFHHGIPKKESTKQPILFVKESDISGNLKDYKDYPSFLSKTGNKTGHITEETVPPFYININKEKQILEGMEERVDKLDTLIPDQYMGKSLDEVVKLAAQEAKIKEHIEDFDTIILPYRKDDKTYRMLTPIALGIVENTDSQSVVTNNLLNIGFKLKKDQQEALEAHRKYWEE